MSASSSGKAAEILRLLSSEYGRIEWWDSDPDGVMIGAILTQQTRWENVERALERLREVGLLSLDRLCDAPADVVERAIRSSGFYRVKARRLQNLARHVRTCGGVERMQEMTTAELRQQLLSVHGVGEETADSILCYGFSRPCFVMDAYTERICRCAGIPGNRDALRRAFENAVSGDPEACRQSHAHIVEYAKERCAKKRCDSCGIRRLRG
ncbi:MAG: Fe-S cluster assembly protein HesB [Methanomicrobiales archaeon]|nr:Fe-S cluster assembly protein HesB [Methanomicrobiales archaeon]MDI6876538.1 Fe-S cluster assembly protein HesB [Methanomicrobiales archaeon]